MIVRMVTALLHGSFVYDEADEFSDVDVVLYFEDESLESTDQTAWVRRIAPLELYFHNGFGVVVAIFDNLVRAEFHFDPASKMSKLDDLRTVTRFPSLEAAILIDKTGRLARHLSNLCGPPLARETCEDTLYTCQSFLNRYLFGSNVLRRGGLARSLEILHLVQDALIRMTRILESSTVHWMTPTRLVEKENSRQAYDRLYSCTAMLDETSLKNAFRNAWEWRRCSMEALTNRFGIALPESQIKKIDLNGAY